MAIFVALLRAVNVGGTGTLAMADLRSMCEDLGFADVRTYIQSGNVVLRCTWAEAGVKSALEGALARKMGKPTRVMVRSAAEMVTALDSNPFPSAEGGRVYVSFFDQAPKKATVATIKAPGGEEMHLAGRELYVRYPEGMGRSKLKLDGLGVATARNMNTVAKLVAMTRE